MAELIESKRFQLGLIVLLIAILFINNGSISLWDQDESAYAGFAYKMNETGNYIIPDFFWSEIHRKPPLHFWNIALSYKIFGVNEFAVRFPSALSIALIYLLVYFTVRKIYPDKKTGIYTVIILATSLFIPVLAKVSVTDASLLLFSTICAIAVYHVLNGRSFYWITVFWVSFALALLVKGPPILLFTGGLFVLLVILHPARKRLLRFHPWFFMPVAFLPLLYWGYLCNKVDGGVFTQWLVDWYILKRVSGSVLGQTGPPGTHIILMAIVFLPYCLFFPKAVKNAFAGMFRKDSKDIFLGAWFVAGWLIYEFSPSKLPAYVVVAHIPLAIIIARAITTYKPNAKRPVAEWTHLVLTSLLYLAFVVAPIFVPVSMSATLLLVCLGIIMLVLNVVTFLIKRDKYFVPALLGMNILFQLAVWAVIIREADNFKNTPKLVGTFIKEHAADNSMIIIGNDLGTPPSLPFYIYQKFKNIRIEKDGNEIHNLFDTYNEKVVFVLNEQQKNVLLSKDGSLHFEEFNIMFTDRKDKSTYFVLVRL